MSGHVTDFAGRVVVITGGASGIGRALGEAFVRAGSHVVLADVEKARLEETVHDLGGTVTGVVTDVTDPDSVEHLAEEVYRRHGAVHVLVNNAGVGAPSADVWDTTPNDWRWVHSVNVFGVAHGVQAFLPRMLAGGQPGHVVNTSSGDGAVNPLPGASVYAASKAAVSTLTECLAVQLAGRGAPIGVSLFLPAGGLLDTGLWTAERNRPAGLARERPRSTPSITVAQLVEAAAAAGRELPVQPLDELAATVLDGIREGAYCISVEREDAARTLHERADRFGRGEVPTIPSGHGILDRS
ncbi:NADP-dependent 3-hydroxy acid dehydrogenase YdfG [Thermomonospora echinospora]|uniref:NADP-dependent 3-hydroxy acid dehydrogenase YdfG n=1 Tax=Thermomonospora echinospora TaxID=1992 RepID=A0A1H5T1P5_9ACTN|nr:SDR family NAD(P)-dependent oxidoreductase [Thermomonospora echinospora]SEF56696.1 NADP-dependent 3-hydroxy acid dehydrogenase YdfG [Thermomonospora echinospora]